MTSQVAKQPRFSVVTIGLNDRAGFEETRASVEAQVFPEFEWLIFDGGSTDGTVDYLHHLDRPNFQWTSEPDGGIYDAMNKGLQRAAGQYIIFMNSGDRFAGQNVLARIDALIAEDGRGSDLVFGDAYEEAADGRLLRKNARPAAAITYGMFTHHQAMVYARSAVAEMRYDCRFVVAADYHFTCRVLARGGRSLRANFPICINQRAGLSEKHSKIGRRENLEIQKQILGLSLTRRTSNYARFVASNLLRTHMRGLYDRIRFRDNSRLLS